MLSELSQKGKENKTTKKPIRVLHVANRQPSFLLSCPEWLHGGWGNPSHPFHVLTCPFKPVLPEVAKLSLFVLKSKHKNLEESIGTRFTLAGESDFWIAAGDRKEGSTFP